MILLLDVCWKNTHTEPESRSEVFNETPTDHRSIFRGSAWLSGRPACDEEAWLLPCLWVAAARVWWNYWSVFLSSGASHNQTVCTEPSSCFFYCKNNYLMFSCASLFASVWIIKPIPPQFSYPFIANKSSKERPKSFPFEFEWYRKRKVIEERK